MAKKKSIMQQMEEAADSSRSRAIHRSYLERLEREKREREKVETETYALSVEELREKKIQFGAMDLGLLEQVWLNEQHEGTKKLVGDCLQSRREQMEKLAEPQRCYENSEAKTYDLKTEELRQKKVQFGSMTMEQLEQVWNNERHEGTKRFAERCLHAQVRGNFGITRLLRSVGT